MHYCIMHINAVVALADDERIIEIIKPELCPACFVIGMPLSRWLDDRMVEFTQTVQGTAYALKCRHRRTDRSRTRHQHL